MADDLGYGDLGCYGQQKILTPNIDQLATEGMRFTQAYAGSSVCAPSRCSLLTGFHNGHNRVRDNIPHGIFLQPDDFTLAELLKQAGYRTAGIGKYSLGNPGSWGIPIYQGFEYYYGHLNQDQAHFYYPDYLWENDKIDLLTGNRAGEKGEFTQDLFTEKALSFIENNHQNPFFLYLPYTTPHYSDYPTDTPDIFPVPSDEPYSGKDWPQVARNYAAMITRMDKDIGEIMDLIRALGIEENTLIIFTSDNGPWQGIPTPIEFFDSNGPLRGGKREMYEGGVRVPFIAKWKQTIPAASTSDHTIAFWDLMPTLAELIGYPSHFDTDGISFLPVLKGNPDAAKEHDYLYWDYGHVRETFMQGVRFDNFKGIAFHRDGETVFELYNLENDPGEESNIAGQHPGLVSRIQELMLEAYEFDENYPRNVTFE